MKRSFLGTAVAAVAIALMALFAGSASAIAIPTPYDECLAANQVVQPAGAVHQKPGIEVCKTVKRTKVTRYQWSIDKSGVFQVTPPGTNLLLPTNTGGSGTAEWTLTATPIPSVSWDITGVIVVRNNGSEPIEGANVVDVVTDSCGVEYPATVDGGTNVTLQPGDNVFTYTSTVPAQAGTCGGGEQIEYCDYYENCVPGGKNVVTVLVGDPQNPVATYTVTFPFAANPPDGPVVGVYNEVVINRKVVMSEDAPTSSEGVTVGPLSDPGPWELLGDGSAASLTRTITATVTKTTCGDGTVDNIARITGTGSIEFPVGEPKTGYTAPPVSGSDQVQLTVSVPCTPPSPPPPPAALTPPPPAAAGVVVPPKKPKALKPRLSVDKRGPARATAGQVVTYTITVRNTGRATARRVRLADVLPPQLSLAARTSGLSVRNGTLSWQLGNLTRGRKITKRIRLRIDSTVTGRRCNTATATASNAPRATDTACTIVAPVASRVQPAVTG